MATSAVGSITFDAFRTFGTAVTHTKVVKDIAKVLKGLIEANVFAHAKVGDTSNKVIAAIDVLEFGESLAYIAKWIDPTYTVQDAKDNPKLAKLHNNLGQVSLLFCRLSGVLKQSNAYNFFTVEQMKNIGGLIPVVRDHLEQFPALDTLGGLFYIPFGGTILFDNVTTVVKSYSPFARESAKIRKWESKAAINIHPAHGNLQARRDAKIEQHTAQMRLERAKIVKAVFSGTSTVFKIAGATTAVVAAFFFGGVAGVLGALVLLGLAGNSLSLGKNFAEAYFDKYDKTLPIIRENARVAAAAA